MTNVTISGMSRPEYLTRIQLFPAVSAGAAAGLVVLAGYYATLALLPTATAWPETEQPVSAWAHRFDLAQFLGTIPFPPVPSLLTWWVGVLIWFGTLAGCGVVYAILLAWTLQRSDPAKGGGFGVALCLALIFGLTLAQGYHPAVMRNALPDTGLLMLGWSVWGPLQLLVLYAVYGSILGALYKRWTQ